MSHGYTELFYHILASPKGQYSKVTTLKRKKFIPPENTPIVHGNLIKLDQPSERLGIKYSYPLFIEEVMFDKIICDRWNLQGSIIDVVSLQNSSSHTLYTFLRHASFLHFNV